MKKIIKRLLPSRLWVYIKKKVRYIDLLIAYHYDLKRYLKHSSTIEFNSRSALEGAIIKEYHRIEKGLTMPEFRHGFGSHTITLLCDLCKIYIHRYAEQSPQVEQGIRVLLEYKEKHKLDGFELNSELLEKINDIEEVSMGNTLKKCNQIDMNRDCFFSKVNESFKDFSNSRKSVRSYIDEELSEDLIDEAIELALNSPSACNRQSARVHVYTNKEKINEILDIQQGARGFGHLTNKLLVITAELSVFANPMERNQAYIDGGIFVMNLLYALHYKSIAACTLNCSNTPKKDILLRDTCSVRDSEAFVAMISCGIPPSNFSITLSKRHLLTDILFSHR